MQPSLFSPDPRAVGCTTVPGQIGSIHRIQNSVVHGTHFSVLSTPQQEGERYALPQSLALGCFLGRLVRRVYCCRRAASRSSAGKVWSQGGRGGGGAISPISAKRRQSQQFEITVHTLSWYKVMHRTDHLRPSPTANHPTPPQGTQRPQAPPLASSPVVVSPSPSTRRYI